MYADVGRDVAIRERSEDQQIGVARRSAGEMESPATAVAIDPDDLELEDVAWPGANPALKAHRLDPHIMGG